MAVFLIAMNGGPDIPLGRSPVLVGRHPVCDVRIGSTRVSRRHCTIAEVDGAVLVRDLRSTNGTRINGRRVEAGWLLPGHELEIADVRYRLTRFREHADDRPSGPQPAGSDAGTVVPPRP